MLHLQPIAVGINGIHIIKLQQLLHDGLAFAECIIVNFNGSSCLHLLICRQVRAQVIIPHRHVLPAGVL